MNVPPSKIAEQRSTTELSSEAHEALGSDDPEREAQKSYHTILEQHIQQAREDLNRPAGGLLLSSLSAGLDLGFGPFLMAVIGTAIAGLAARPVVELAMAAAYTVGFVFVVLGRSALFTEQTTSAVLPVLAQRSRMADLVRLWALVLLGNLAVAALIAAVIANLGPALGILTPEVLETLARKLLDHRWWITLSSAIAAGWLMGLLSWLVVASRDTMSQIAIVVLTTFVIGIAGLHHSIAGSIEVLAALFARTSVEAGELPAFMTWSIVGNAIGGSVFVALLKFGHVRASISP